MYAEIPDDIYNAMLKQYDEKAVSKEEFLECLDILTRCETQEEADRLYIKPVQKFINRSPLFLAWMKRISSKVASDDKKNKHIQENMNEEYVRLSSLETARHNFGFFLALLIKPFKILLEKLSYIFLDLADRGASFVLIIIALALAPIAGPVLIMTAFGAEFCINCWKLFKGEMSGQLWAMNTVNIAGGFVGSLFGGVFGGVYSCFIVLCTAVNFDIHFIYDFRSYVAIVVFVYLCASGFLVGIVVGGSRTLDWIQERTSEIFNLPMSRGLEHSFAYFGVEDLYLYIVR